MVKSVDPLVILYHSLQSGLTDTFGGSDSVSAEELSAYFKIHSVVCIYLLCPFVV